MDETEIFSSKLLTEAMGTQFPSQDIKSVQLSKLSQTKSNDVLENNDNKKDSLIVLSHPCLSNPEHKDELIEVALDYTEQIVAKLLGNKKRAILEEKTSRFNGSVMKLV